MKLSFFLPTSLLTFSSFASTNIVEARIACDPSEVVVVRNVNLGLRPLPTFPFDGPLLMDSYHCPNDSTGVLNIFAVGGSIPPIQYTEFATGMAAMGYATLVLQVPVAFGPDIFSIVKPEDFTRAISYAEVNPQLPSTDVVLSGHSFGSVAVLSALGETCSFATLCGFPGAPPSYPILSPKVKGAAGFGVSIFDRNGNPNPLLTNQASTDGSIVPFMTFNGDGDIITISGSGQSSYDNFVPEKVYVVGTNLDHASIQDSFSPGSTIIPSTLERSEQIEIVVEEFSEWFEFVLEGQSSCYCDGVKAEVEECLCN